jgi:hypothetical protein
MELTSHLVDKFQETKIEFRQVLMGVTSERHRWHQCVEWTNKKLGMALGALFIRDNFDPVAKVSSHVTWGSSYPQEKITLLISTLYSRILLSFSVSNLKSLRPRVPCECDNSTATAF